MHLSLTLPRAGFDVSVDVQLPMQGITAIFGPSGSGKTSVLRCVAGLEPAAQGVVRLGDQCWLDSAHDVNVPTHRRALGYVFQEASLFPHLDVAANLRYGMQRSAQTDPSVLQEAVNLLGIGSLMQRAVTDLSGGERQRVAIARALVTRPRVLLLDEPLSALDVARRQEIMPWLEKLRDELQLPMLYVTHSLEEVTRLADTLWVLENGRTQALGPLNQVLGAVASPEQWGDEAGALLEAQVVTRDTAWGLAEVAFDGGRLWLRDSGLTLGQAVRVRVLARDVSITETRAQGTSIQNHLSCTVDAILQETHPAQVLVRLRLPEASVPTHLLARITARAAHELQLIEGAPVWAQVKSVALVK
jgi:molybdate transport system ATP-binding protein